MHCTPILAFGYERVVSIDAGLSEHGYAPAAAAVYSGPNCAVGYTALPGVTSVSLVKLAPLGHKVARIDTDIQGAKWPFSRTRVGRSSSGRWRHFHFRMGRNFPPRRENAVIVTRVARPQAMAGRESAGQTLSGKTQRWSAWWGNARINALNDGDSNGDLPGGPTADMPEMVVISERGDLDSLTPMAKSIV